MLLLLLRTSSTFPFTEIFAGMGEPDISIIAVACLVFLMGTLEILAAAETWNDRPLLSFKLATWPLTVVFILIIISNVIDIISSF
jgi:hypothetical protein